MDSSSTAPPHESPIEALFFREKFLADERDPVFAFSAFGGRYGLLAVNLPFWYQVTLLLVFQSALSVAIAAVAYKFVIPRRGTSTAHLVSFGILLPLVLHAPFWLARRLRLRNRGLLFSMNNLSTVATFRLLETSFGTSAPGAEASLPNYCLYCASVAQVEYDAATLRPRRAARGEALRRLGRGLAEYALVGALLSAGRPTGFEPFPSHGVDCASFRHGWGELVHWGHLLNNAYVALMFFLVLSFSLTLVSAVISLLTGCKTIDPMKDPLFSSARPSEFWGERWNQNVQSMLKRAIYKPLRKSGFPFTMAATATFLASGVLHEFCWLVLFLRHEDCSSRGTCFEHVRGTHMAFFGWNGLVILTEFFVGGLWIFQIMKQTLPPVAVAMLVLLTALPVSHWFTGSLIKGDFFEHLSYAAPIIVKLSAREITLPANEGHTSGL